MSKRPIRRKPRSQQSSGARPDSSYRWFIVVALAAIAATAISMVIRNPRPVPASPSATPLNSTILAAEIRDPRVGEVEQRFRCPCGQCGGKDLIECGCDAPGGALEMKAAIMAELDAGTDVEATVAAIAARYPGALKATVEAAQPAQLEQSSHSDVLLAVAGRIDCPCGDCKLRLLDCDCSKDRGAREVKTFVRERARAGRTTSEIIAAFDRVYGGSQG